MKEMILVRHAKSSWAQPGLPDRERPLNKRGERDAPRMGERLADTGVQVERIVTSPAVRTVLTAEAVAEELAFDWDQVVMEEQLYGADTDDWFEVAADQNDYLDTILLVGHNPGLTAFVNSFLQDPLDNVPTCGIARLHFDIDSWHEIETVDPVEVQYSIPKKEGWRQLR